MMCDSQDGMTSFVLRAIAAGAAGPDLAKFALEEREKIRKDQQIRQDEMKILFEQASK